MGLLNNFHSIFFFLYIIIKQFFPAKSEIKVFPDHISAGDPIFNKSQVYSVTNERFIYKLGYFTTASNDAKIFSKKYGIYYEPVSCTGGTIENSNTFFIDKIIGNSHSTIEKGKNFFEEIDLFTNVMRGNDMSCDSHLKIIHNKNIEITYIIPVLSLSDNNFILNAIPPDSNDEYEICNVALKASILKMIKIDIKTDTDNTLGSYVRMVFTCTDSTRKVYINSKGDGYYTFRYMSGSSQEIILSNFRITVEDTLIKTGSVSNKNLIRSKIGLSNSDSCKIQNSDEDCFRGYLCNIDKCEKCHYSCSQCYRGNSFGSCSICSPLTISDNQKPDLTTGLCPINFVDISQFKDFTIEIYPNGDEFNERATMGLWLFFSDLTNSRSRENDIYHIVLENRIVMSLYPGDDKITAYCHTFEDLYRKVTSDTQLFASYADKSSEYVVSIVIPGEEDSTQKDRLDIETMNGKWFHISCGISYAYAQEQFYIKSVVNGKSVPKVKP